MSNLERRLEKLEAKQSTAGQQPFYVLHEVGDGQVFHSGTETFYPDEEAFLSAMGKAKEEVFILLLRHECTAEEFLESRERAKVAGLTMENHLDHGRQAATNFYRTL